MGSELHYADGCSLHSFLSPVNNSRGERYGDSLANRMRVPLEVFSAVAEVWPGSEEIGARISGSDFRLAEDAWGIDDAIAFGNELPSSGAQFLDVSGGRLSPERDFMSTCGPDLRVSLPEPIKQEVGLPTLSTDMPTHRSQTEDIVTNGRADGVAIARGMLLDPRWPRRAALELGAQPTLPPQCERTFSFGDAQLVVGENSAVLSSSTETDGGDSSMPRRAFQAVFAMLSTLWAAPSASAHCHSLPYVTDLEGTALAASKSALIAAVESGEHIRIGWRLDFDGDSKGELAH